LLEVSPSWLSFTTAAAAEPTIAAVWAVAAAVWAGNAVVWETAVVWVWAETVAAAAQEVCATAVTALVATAGQVVVVTTEREDAAALQVDVTAAQGEPVTVVTAALVAAMGLLVRPSRHSTAHNRVPSRSSQPTRLAPTPLFNPPVRPTSATPRTSAVYPWAPSTVVGCTVVGCTVGHPGPRCIAAAQ